MAVSVFIRLGFAHKKNDDVDQSQLHPSWNNIPSPHDDAPPDLLTSPLLPADFGRDIASSPEGDDVLESNPGVTLGIPNSLHFNYHNCDPLLSFGLHKKQMIYELVQKCLINISIK